MSSATDPASVWKRIAGWWDGAVGEGNEFQIQLIMPATDRLLGVRAGERVLDVGCGNGNYSRRMGRAGAEVVGVDVAEGFVEAARRRTGVGDGKVEYRVVDATDEGALVALGGAGAFDAAVCSMALMDLPVLDPLLSALAVLLKSTGRFVFSIPHPCFNSAYSRMTAELVNEGGRMEQVYGVSVLRYITPGVGLSAGMLNQPEPHYLFHRPLSELVGTFGRHGFVMDGVEEPVFAAGGAGGKNAFSWKARPEIPPALVGRLVRGR
jgi:SAM-dependent methyltransferase